MAASFKVQNAGTLRTITGGKVRVAGVTRTLKTAKVMHGGSLRTVAIFASPLTVSASPSAAQGDFAGSGALPPQGLETNLVTAIPSGGFAPYTYAWTHVSGDTFTVTNPSSASTYFAHTFTSYGTRSGVYRCTVTDSLGSTATVDVNVLIQFTF